MLAALGQSITTQWSLTPISGLHYWWILVTSPETLIFLFFMITDPRTTPTGRMRRIVFGAAVGVMSTVLLAPWPTEFGTKVGLLSGLRRGDRGAAVRRALVGARVARTRTERAAAIRCSAGMSP